jgi:hypothetical protein
MQLHGTTKGLVYVNYQSTKMPSYVLIDRYRLNHLSNKYGIIRPKLSTFLEDMTKQLNV